jgi:hypothetical protein
MMFQKITEYAMQASKDFFNGKHFNNATTGEGLKSYLDYVKAVRSGNNLAQSSTISLLQVLLQIRH